MMQRGGKMIFGVEATIRKLHDTRAREDASRIAQQSATRISQDAASMAPVLTGLMRRTILEGVRKGPQSSWEIVQLTDYTLYQEYHNSRGKQGFLRKAIRNEEQKFVDDMKKRFKGGFKGSRGLGGW